MRHFNICQNSFDVIVTFLKPRLGEKIQPIFNASLSSMFFFGVEFFSSLKANKQISSIAFTTINIGMSAARLRRRWPNDKKTQIDAESPRKTGTRTQL